MKTFVVATVVVGCGCGGEASQTRPVTLPVQSAPAASSSASSSEVCTNEGATASKPCGTSDGSDSGAREATPSFSSTPRLCGCGLCEPVLSSDACKADSDCLPATPCHAKTCVAAAHAQPRAANTQCTEILECDAIEANRCACVRPQGSSGETGRCALAPRIK